MAHWTPATTASSLQGLPQGRHVCCVLCREISPCPLSHVLRVPHVPSPEGLTQTVQPQRGLLSYVLEMLLFSFVFLHGALLHIHVSGCWAVSSPAGVRGPWPPEPGLLPSQHPAPCLAYSRCSTKSLGMNRSASGRRVSKKTPVQIHFHVAPGVGITDIWGHIALCGRAVLHTTGRLAVASAHWMPVSRLTSLPPPQL